jgi:hypothetical protein
MLIQQTFANVIEASREENAVAERNATNPLIEAPT